jgi:hypothetical protein
MNAPAKEMISVRMPAELMAAVKQRAEDEGGTFSDVIRDGALMILGHCPTCGRRAEDKRPAEGGA